MPYTKRIYTLLSILVAIGITIGIIYKLQRHSHLLDVLTFFKQPLQFKQVILLIVTVLLMLLNWSIEAYKWQQLLLQLSPITFIQSIRSVFAGISLSLITPNRIGEYAGRLVPIPHVPKTKGIVAQIVGNMAQFMAAGWLGVISGCVYITINTGAAYLIPVVVCSTLVLVPITLFYFSVRRVSKYKSKWALLNKALKYFYFIQYYPKHALIKIFLISVTRYLLFALQYYLLLKALQVPIFLHHTIIGVLLVFWLMAIIPTIGITELPVRTQVAYQILSVYATAPLPIFIASILLWLINLVLPAIVGTMFFIRFIKRPLK